MAVAGMTVGNGLRVGQFAQARLSGRSFGARELWYATSAGDQLT